jgi:hypothetical protein
MMLAAGGCDLSGAVPKTAVGERSREITSPPLGLV